MFNLQEVLGADLHILSTHGHIFVTFFAFLLGADHLTSERGEGGGGVGDLVWS